MPHKFHNLAKQVIADADKHSHAAIRLSKTIDDWFNSKRELVKFFASNREVLRDYRRFYSNSMNVTRLQKHRCAITQMQPSYPFDVMQKFHVFRGQHRNAKVKLFSDVFRLQNVLALEVEPDLDLVYDIVQKLNTGDDVTEPPELHWVVDIGMSTFVEVLLWRLTK